MSHTDYQDAFHAYGRKLLSKVYETLGFDVKPDDSHTTKILRMAILNGLLSFEDPKILEESRWRFKSRCDCKNPIDPDLRSVVYCGVLHSCDDETFEKFWQKPSTFYGQNSPKTYCDYHISFHEQSYRRSCDTTSISLLNILLS